MSDRLREYLRWRERGGFGWVPKYEASVNPKADPPWFTGWYSGMLDEAISAVGQSRLRNLLDALEAIDRPGIVPPAPAEGPSREALMELYAVMVAKRDASVDPTNELGRSVVAAIARCEREGGSGAS